MKNNKNDGNAKNAKTNDTSKKYSSEDIDNLQKEADKERSRKPGSQSNWSGRHNNGRGGGK